MSATAVLAPERTPARPGPGPIPEALVRALDFTVRRRVDSLLSGEHRSAALGRGSELAQIRPYVPGDDVRRIDWNATARTGETQLREDVAERALTSWLLLDTSRSMTFGTADRRKADVAEGVALALAHVATRRGGRLGLVSFGRDEPRVLPPRQGRLGMLGLLTELRRSAPPDGGGTTDLAGALAHAAAVARQRSLVVCVTDMRGPRDWRRPLLGLLDRHEVVVVEVRDRREQQIPDVGVVWMVDPETGRRARIDTSDHVLRRRFATDAAAERDAVASELRALGVEHCVLGTEGDWLRILAAFLARREARR